MKLFRYALLLVVLVFVVSIASASVSTSLTGTTNGNSTNIKYITGYDITCTATSTKTNGAYMIFHWWVQGTSIDYYKTISKNSNKYVCTLPANQFMYAGNWHVSCQEYTSAMVGIPGQSTQAQFTAVSGGTVSSVSVNYSSYDYGDSVLATASVNGTTPVTFYWYRPGESTPIRTYTDSTGPSYTDTYADVNVVGTWKVVANQSTSSSYTTFTVSAEEAGINTILITGEISPVGSFVLTEDITATATSSDSDNDSDDGVKMMFKWYSPSGACVQTTNVSKINGTYTSILKGGTSATAGSWHVNVYEYNASNGIISTGTEEFNTEESYTISGTQNGSNFVTGYDVTCSVYSPDIDGSYMIFDWYSPSSSTPVQSIKIYENDYYFICTLPARYFTTPGNWTIVGTEYNSTGGQMDTVRPMFTAVNNGGTISLSGISDTYTYGSSVTATATATGTTPVTFYWYRPNESTPIRTHSDSTLTFNDTYADANVVGTWKVVANQSIYSATKTFTVSRPPNASITFTGTTSTSGALVLNESVTAKVTSYYSGGVKMIFEWYSPSGTRVRLSNVTLANGTYIDTLPAASFSDKNYSGSWHLHVYEYNSAGTLISSSQEEFEAEDVPEFPIIGSFLPMLLAGAVYVKVRKNREGS